MSLLARLPALLFLAGPVLLAVPALLAAREPGEGWPRWSGPNHDLTVDDAGVFDRPGFGLERVWVHELGSGYSGIVAEGDTLVTAFADGTSDVVAALDATAGEELWRYVIGPMYAGHDGSHDGPNGTPLVHDGRVYGLGPRGHLFALRLDDGAEVFSVRIDEAHGARPPDHGFTTSPIVVDGVLVVQTGGGPGRAVSGFHPETGALLWQAGDGTVEYQSPLALEVDGRELVFAVANERILGLGARTGAVLFEYPLREEHQYVASQPIPLGDGRIVLTGRFSSSLFQVRATDGQTATGHTVTEIWTTRGLRGSYTVPVAHDGYLYGYRGHFLTCVDAATGETVWTSRPPGRGTLIVVDGHLVVLASSGDLVVAEASPDGFRETTRAQALGDGSYTAPTFARSRFYVRNLEEIAAVDVVDLVERPAVTPDALGRETPPPDVEVHGVLADLVGKAEAARTVEEKEAWVTELLASQERFPIVEGNRWAHFVHRGDVEDLALVGNFDSEDEGERVMGRIAGTDFYYRSVEVSPAAHYTYRFQVFGEPLLDSLNSRTVELPTGAWSELAMPGWPEPEHLAEPEGPRGRLETLTWTSPTLGNTRDVRVYLPAGYDESDARHPLLVVDEGDEALHFGRMADSLDHLIGDTVAPMVVAFVPSRSFRELATVRGLDDLTEAMVSELLPELAARYRLIDGPGAHAIMGTAFGATHAVYAALKRRDVFGRVAVQSYYGYRSRDAVAKMLEDGRGEGLRAVVELNVNDLRFAVWADAEAESRELVERLRQGGADVATHEVADGPDWSSWRSRTDVLLEALFPRR